MARSQSESFNTDAANLDRSRLASSVNFIGIFYASAPSEMDKNEALSFNRFLSKKHDSHLRRAVCACSVRLRELLRDNER